MDKPETRVVNRYRESYDVYIGRPSKWGNPFSHRDGTAAQCRVGSLEEALAAYELWIRSRPDLLAQLGELRGKRLGCTCKPRPCHGDVLLKLLSEAETR